MDATQSYKPYPWPFGQPSILNAPVELEEQRRRQAGYWLDVDIGEDDDASDSDYVQTESSESDTSSDSPSDTDSDISESELAYIRADAQTAYRPYSPTPSLKAAEEQEKLTLQIADLVKAEEDAAAAYSPDEVVSLITQFLELLVNMGHWPEGSIRYAPHTDPPVDEQLAVQLGYAPAAISLMHRLPYLSRKVNNDGDTFALVYRAGFADYTLEYHLKEGRRPYPYYESDIDPWLLPIMLAGREGWNIMLDTRLGAIRAYCTYMNPPSDTVEWKRHAVPNEKWEEAVSKEYRRAPLVPAARYFLELIYAYRSLSRLPVINADLNDPKQEARSNEGREKQQTLLALYLECGWPDQWRRVEFLAKWETLQNKRH
ncbi:hypothetical protein B0H19DRAFT_1248105 [Mycena capillaripes]|nr:hypothetical protein B0H19DRAFT_1248105 [Mycena capillaripes]